MCVCVYILEFTFGLFIKNADTFWNLKYHDSSMKDARLFCVSLTFLSIGDCDKGVKVQDCGKWVSSTRNARP